MMASLDPNFLRRHAHTLIYDRDCELCCWARDQIRLWDRHGRIAYLAFQEPEFMAQLPDFDRSDPLSIWPEGLPPRAMLYIDHQGSLWQGVEAFRKLLPRLPGGKFLALFFLVPGVPRLAEVLYQWLARNRYRLFGASRR